MALDAYAIEVLIRLKREGHIRNRASVIEIGAQQLNDSALNSGANIATLGGLFASTVLFHWQRVAMPPGQKIFRLL